MNVNLSLWIWVLVAVAVAWSVGAYSRLLRLRDGAVRARASLIKHLLRYHAQISAIISTQSALDLADAMQTIAMLAAQWERDVRNGAVPTGLGMAIDEVWQRIGRVRVQPDDLAGAPIPPDLLAAWDELGIDVTARRTRYNVHVAELNEAVTQLPTRFLARLTGMTPWETL